MNNKFAQTKRLLLFYLKKDAIKLVLWTIALIVFSVGIIAYFPSLYPTVEDKIAIATTMNTPSMIAMAGPLYGDAPYTIGALASQEVFIFAVILVCIMNINIVLKNTRQQEDEGMLEMINSFSVGRYTNILAVFLELLLVNTICAFITIVGLNAINIEGIDYLGAFVYGATTHLVGLVFGCFTLVFVQIASDLRSASFISYSFFGGMYLLRAIGDISNDKLTWLSPLGWAIKSEVFVNNKFLPIIISSISCLLLLLLAFYINKNRDLGSGILVNKAKKIKTSFTLKTPLGFFFRLERFLIISWLVIIVVIGVAYGSIFGELDSFLDNETVITITALQDNESIAKAFIPLLTLINSLMLAIPCVLIISKLASEENNERIEQLYALPLSRTKTLLIHLFLSISTLIIGLLFSSTSIWFVSSLVMENPLELSLFIDAAIAYFPAVLIIISINIFLLGWLKKLIKIIWIYLLYGFIVVYFGNLLDLPAIIKNLSPFGIIPRVPLESLNMNLFISMIIISIVVSIIGFIGYKKRDISK
ncbi:ABC-2 type transport system permease protein [Bacilli bacterium PM5-3]|nr:ABC-2 type transport system permease protein [Bacilli bacterium PM5-3]MDH6603448.1 ABC-2 type transport system permease protein [Bacilli bacterium PM5-9]